MLILRRKVNERIIIGETITVFVMEIEQNNVKLGMSISPTTSNQQASERILQGKVNERFDIREAIALFVIGIGSDDVTLGISAPREVSIVREENYAGRRKKSISKILKVSRMSRCSEIISIA